MPFAIARITNGVSTALLLSGMMLALGSARAQQRPGLAVKGNHAPRRIVYLIFFRQVYELDQHPRTVTALPAGQVRSYFQQQIGLSDGDFGALKQSAVNCLYSVGRQDAKAMVLIDRVHAQIAKLAPGQHYPPVPPGLAQLQAERDDLLNGCIANLQADLPDAFQKIDDYVTNIFAGRTFARQVAVPRTPGNAGTGGDR